MWRVAAHADDYGKDEPRKKSAQEVHPETTLKKKDVLSDSEESAESSSVSLSKQTAAHEGIIRKGIFGAR